MATTEEVEDFLEHFGVKGMRWGQRKTHSSGGRTSEQKLRRQKQIKVGAAVVGVVALAGGAYVARGMLKEYGGKNVSSLPKLTDSSAAKAMRVAGKGREASSRVSRVNGAIPMPAGRILSTRGNVRIKDLPKNAKLTPDQAVRYRKIMANIAKQGSMSATEKMKFVSG